MAKEYELSDENIEQIFNRLWEKRKKEKNYTSVNEPKGFVLGGQPGAGKSNSIGSLKAQHFGENVVVVNGDEFRRFHPKFEEINAKYGEESVNYTGQLSGRITQMMIDKSVEERLNVIVEGTFRTAETPMNTLKQFKDADYSTGVVIATTEAETSWESTKERYDKMKAAGELPRYTPKAGHDLTVDRLGENADRVYQSGLADTFAVNNRQGELWNSSQPGMPSQAINDELNKIKLNVLDHDGQQVLAEVNASIENQDMPYRRKEEQYSTFRQALLTNQEKGIEIEQAKPGRTYSGEIVTISENTIIQQSKINKIVKHEPKNLTGIESSDVGKYLKVNYDYQNKGVVVERDGKVIGLDNSLEREKSNHSENDLSK